MKSAIKFHMPLNSPSCLQNHANRAKEITKLEVLAIPIRPSLDHLRDRFYIWNPKYYKLEVQQ